MSIAENYKTIRHTMEAACKKAGRPVEDVQLIAVTKYVDTARIAEALACGVRAVGENHAQELTEKLTFFEQNACDIHFIGQLQTNKVKYVCGNARLIQSVDRLHLAEALQHQAEKMGIRQDILIQVNIGDEPQKGGIPTTDAIAFCKQAAAFVNLRICGIMCVPPVGEPESARAYFAKTRALFESMQSSFPELPINTLSMGMSHDYDIAIEEGATMVRVGTALFGQRNYQ